MNSSDTKSYYKEHREEIITASKQNRLENKKACLTERSFPLGISEFSRVNIKNVTIKLKKIEEFDKLINLRNEIRAQRDKIRNVTKDESDQYYAASRAEKLEEGKAPKLRNKIAIIKSKGFPHLLCLWARVSDGKITLSFETPEIFDEFIAIMEDLYIERQAQINEKKE